MSFCSDEPMERPPQGEALRVVRCLLFVPHSRVQRMTAEAARMTLEEALRIVNDKEKRGECI